MYTQFSLQYLSLHTSAGRSITAGNSSEAHLAVAAGPCSADRGYGLAYLEGWAGDNTVRAAVAIRDMEGCLIQKARYTSAWIP